MKRSLERKHGGTETIKAIAWIRKESDQVEHRIVEEAEVVERAFDASFTRCRPGTGWESREFSAAKQELRQRLNELVRQLNRYLAGEYGIDADKKPKEFAKWEASHEPFHWFAEFYGIMNPAAGLTSSSAILRGRRIQQV